ncbi:MAG: DUF2846 domain-containing protein [Cyclobacteriaceae bacterium]
MNKLIFSLIVGLFLTDFSAIASYHLGKGAEEATVYLIRYGVGAPGIPSTIELNQQYVGRTLPYSYIQLSVEPGKHRITANLRNRYSVDMTVEAGKSYYLRQYIVPGAFFPGTRIEMIDEEDGVKLLNQNKPITEKKIKETIVDLDN